jgi:small subunit ribosomal protein S20
LLCSGDYVKSPNSFIILITGGPFLANTKSAAKRARVALRRRSVNARRRSTVKTWEKKLRKALVAKDAKVAKEILPGYVSQIMKAAKAGVLHSANASRKVARLSEQVSRL